LLQFDAVRMRNILNTYAHFRYLFIGLLLALLSFVFYNSVFYPNVEKDVKGLENRFQNRVKQLKITIEEFSNSINYGDELSVIWDNTRKFRNTGFDFFVFHGDSLFYWTTNHVAGEAKVLTSNESGVVLLENGWYYRTAKFSGGYTMVGLFLIKREYPYENESLINDFHSDLRFPYRANIEMASGEHDVHFGDGGFAFSMNQVYRSNFNASFELLVFGFFLLSGFFILYGIWRLLRYNIRHQVARKWSIIGYIALLLLVHGLIGQIDWQYYFPDFELFNPKVFASSSWLPTLGDLFVKVLFFVILTEILVFSIRRLKIVNAELLSKVLGITFFGLFLLLSYTTTTFISQVIRDSDVPMTYYNVMSLTPFSFVFLVIFFILLWCYFNLSTSLLRFASQSALSKNVLGAVWFVGCSLYMIYSISGDVRFIIVAAMPVIFSLALLLIEPWKTWRLSFSQAIVLLALFSLYLSLQLNLTLNRKELEIREVYAKKLISEKELDTEIEYANLGPNLVQSDVIQGFFEEQDVTQVQEIKRTLERKFFQGYWNRYEIEFFFTDKEKNAISAFIQINEDPAKKYDSIIEKSGLESELTRNIFYITDFADNLSYLVRESILNDAGDSLGCLYLALRSKVIPQEIGFPRLLLNDNSKVFFKLDDYNMAKYVHGKLVTRYGSYNYPLAIGSFLIDFQNKSGILTDEDFVHQVIHGESNKTIILSRQKVGFEEYLTTFSFLFATFGLFLIINLIGSGRLLSNWGKIKLAFRIQLIFILLVFFSLLFSGVGTGTYVQRQYREYQEGLLREKVSSVQKELQSKLAFESALDPGVMGNYLEFLLNKFSVIFVSDMNLYDTRGQLIASSRPEIFNLGLLSQQMNSRAFRQMYNRMLSLYVNNERIGNQNYLSAYVPLLNGQGQLIAYLNLPYFAKQNAFESEIAGFLSAIINIFVLLFAVSIVIGVFVTSRIVDPLKQIQASLSGFKLGSEQKPIAYKGDDEIGVLVQEYNTKLRELQESSEKLAKTEREMAWREMAKQVAHEIKNPLTPMKLRIQHFQRSFDPNAEDADVRIAHFSDSLIEQIEALTNIANAFSNFAKMPKAQLENVDLVRIIRSVVDTFSAEENIEIITDFNSDQVCVNADKELMLRVFNNLIKNAIQAIPKDQQGQISITLLDQNKAVIVRVMDTGTGISDDMKDKIFVPNFTTKSTGTGLGLAMVKQIIESHDGQISFESVPGNTIFTIRLPKNIK
jgi:two-component system, NtrC family, nitrogen regulation sensor histidine kinase NtrY